MTVLNVRLFGHLSVLYDNIPVTTLQTSRLQELFAYLLIHRSALISHSYLAYQFWRDSTETQARTNLRNLIYQLRRAFPESDRFFQWDSSSIAWQNEADFTLDIIEFENCLKTIPENEPLTRGLQRAVEIYRGDLLLDCYSDWVIPERERLRQAYLNALETLASKAEDTRDYSCALDYAKRLVQAEPLLSSANLRLIRLYSLLEDRTGAIKAYQVYDHRLQLDLGVKPEAEIRDLYQRILEQDKNASKSTKLTTTPLIGRSAEWRQLRSWWQTVSRHGPQIGFVSGDAGIGKTRLVEELSRWAELQSIPTATAICYPAEGSLPYAPVVSWIRALPLPPLEETWRAEISRLVPEIKQKPLDLPEIGPLRETWQRQRLFEALARALLTRQHGLILDDLAGDGTGQALVDCAAGLANLITNMTAYIDRVPVDVTSAFRTQVHPFTLGPLPDNNIPQVIFGNPAAVEGATSEAAGDGYYLMLGPVPKGQHTIVLHGEVPELDFALDIAYKIIAK